MKKILSITIISFFLSSHVAFAGSFAKSWSSLLASNKKAASLLGSERGKKLFQVLLESMKHQGDILISYGYQMDDEDQALLNEVTHLAQ